MQLELALPSHGCLMRKGIKSNDRASKPVCLKYPRKVFQLQIINYIFKSILIAFVNYFGHVAQNTNTE